MRPRTLLRLQRWWRIRSDGIASVHGMANVQAEELVEYVAIVHF